MAHKTRSAIAHIDLASHIPIVPSRLERTLLQRLHWQRIGCKKTAASDIANAYIAKFDHYITDGPGYAGPLYVIAWSGGPSLFDVVIRDSDDRLMFVTNVG